MPEDTHELENLVVLVTRPLHQAEALQAMLRRMGAEVVQHALLSIAPPTDSSLAQSALVRVEDSDIVVFTSANAVRAAVSVLPQFAASLQRPLVACLGMATARALHSLAIVPDIMPLDGNTSEHFLAMDEMSGDRIQGRRVTIIKGEGGRSLLARTLQDRGADIELIDVYRREPGGDGLQQLFQDCGPAHKAKIDIAIVTSGEALERMCDVVTLEHLQNLAFVLPSDRVVEQAISKGLRGPFIVPQQVNDGELAQASCRLAQTIKNKDEKNDNE